MRESRAETQRRRDAAAPWPKVRLGDVVEILLGKMLDQKKNRGEPRKYLGNVDVRWGSFDFDNIKEMPFLEKEIERYSLKAGDIVMCEGGEPGRCAIWKDEFPGMMYQKALHRIRPNERLDAIFLYYYFLLHGRRNGFDGYSTGSTIKHLPREQLLKIPIPLPPLPLQRAIAERLSAYDNLIENNNKRIAILEKKAEELYKEWFVRYRFPGHQKAKWVGDLPDGWRKGKIHEVVKVYDEKRIPLSSIERDKQKKIYPYYGAAELMDYVESYIFDGLYLLMGEDGSVITPEGYPVLQLVNGKFWVNNHAHILQGEDGFSTELLYLMLKRMNISGIVTGSAQPKISQGRLLNWRIVIPEKSLIEKAGESVRPIFEMMRNLQRQNALLVRKRDLLLPRLMSGRMKP